MRKSRSHRRILLSAIAAMGALCTAGAGVFAQGAAAPTKGQLCPADDSGLKLPAGFCATIFAEDVGHARHMVVAPNGVVYVNTWSGRYYGNDRPPEGGFLIALQDTRSVGRANIQQRFGDSIQSGAAGGTGIGLYKGAIYAELNDRIVRYTLTPGSIAPKGPAEVIVSGLPLGGDHPMHPFVIDDDGSLYIDVGSATNACQLKNRTLKSPGANPCTELLTRGGVWRYDANKTNQKFSPAGRFATGIRNGEGFAIDSQHHVYVTQHGRDQLATNWPGVYKPEQEATLPAEEVLRLEQGGDYGWPECYFDPGQDRLVLAPEYGGDGKSLGPCATKLAPVAVFPAHWAPNDLTLYDKGQFPSRYRGGAFIAFHGSWNRAPFPQGGYNVVFQPLNGGKSSGKCEIFADGFAGAVRSPGKAAHRPSGLAVAPDGALYVSDDVRGRIYRIVYLGAAFEEGDDAKITPCPSASAPAGGIDAGKGEPPEGTHADAGAAGDLPVPNGATKAMVALGDAIYRGQVGAATCTGCHGADGSGTPLGPNLTDATWLWGDGSYAAITRTVADGVMQPKQYRSAMPPMGGAQLTHEQVSAVAAYVWSLSHGSKSGAAAH